MAYLRVIGRSFALVGFGAAWLQAQSTRAHVIVAPQGRPRIAVIAPPPPPPQPLTTYGETVFQSYPVIVTPDGRVLIDLGNGYEQVARSCPYAYGYGCQSYGYPVAPFTPIPQSYAPPNYVAPRYAPPAYGAPVYPTPTYPQGGYYGNYPPTNGYGGYPVAPQPGYVPNYQPPPTNNNGGCPPGYIPTGSYPPCIDPSRTPVNSAPMPAGTSPRSVGHRPASTAAAHVVRR